MASSKRFDENDNDEEEEEVEEEEENVPLVKSTKSKKVTSSASSHSGSSSTKIVHVAPAIVTNDSASNLKRIPVVNIGPIAFIFHVIELFYIITTMLIMINLGIHQTSLGSWVVPVLLVTACLYLLAWIVSLAITPKRGGGSSSRSSWYGLDQRKRRYHNNDTGHFFEGFVYNFFLTLAYLLWFYAVAYQSTDINPLTDPVLQDSQINVVTACFILNLILFAKFTKRNNLDEEGNALADYQKGGKSKTSATTTMTYNV